MLSISLNQLRFHAFHGVYEEERLIGNEYEVDVHVSFPSPAVPVNDLEQTIDYTAIYEIIRDRMMQPTPLLETIVMELEGLIRARFTNIREINISIRKLHLPVPHFQGNVSVSYRSDKSSI